MEKKKLKRLMIVISLSLIVMACGTSSMNEGQTILTEQNEGSSDEWGNVDGEVREEEIYGKTAGRQVVLENERLRKCVCQQLGKEEESPIYEEELESYKGTLRGTSSFVIGGGDDLNFVRTYFDMDTFYDFQVTFTPDGSNWTTQQLQGLGDLKRKVRVSSTENTVPAEVLTYLTGTDELIFDMTDIEGEVPANQRFPENIKKVMLYDYAPGRYTNLLNYMQNSEVESLTVFRDYDVKDSNYFRLDQIAGMKNLLSLDLEESYVRVDNPEKLDGIQLQYLYCSIDDGVDLSFLKELRKLEMLECAVTEEVDLSKLLGREELSLRLRFCQETIEFEEDVYPEGKVVILPKLDEELKWKEEDEDEEHFLAIYQRFIDGEKKIECFSIRCLAEEDGYWYNMYNVRTFLRGTVDGQVQILKPEGDDPELADFGEYRHDYVTITDINFDGIKDIMLDTGGFGNQLASYAFAWIWEEESGSYVRSESFGQIINPSVDTEQKLVRSAWRNWAASHSWAIYKYEDEEYTIKSVLTESLLYGDQIPEDMQTSENGEVWEWVEKIYEDGKVVETKSFMVLKVPGEKTEYPDAYYKFSEPDSYWGG
ncbi:MAG: hypothetical protein HDQ96_04055 [Lachnospiraceae bacterium]|nr:hypothetical protein [Lachnospiraceae bacterium]